MAVVEKDSGTREIASANATSPSFQGWGALVRPKPCSRMIQRSSRRTNPSSEAFMGEGTGPSNMDAGGVEEEVSAEAGTRFLTQLDWRRY